MKNNTPFNFHKRKQRWKYILFITAVTITSLSIYLTQKVEKSLEDSINSLSQSIETLKENESTLRKNETIIRDNINTLKKEEEDNIGNFTKAMRYLNTRTIDDDSDTAYTWASDLIQQNKTIPLILVDECHNILINRNINFPKNINQNEERKEEYLLKELDVMKREGDSIKINVLTDDQTLYYKNSEILTQTKLMESQTIIMRGQTEKMQYFINQKEIEIERLLNEMKWYPYYQLAFLVLFGLLAYLIFNAARRSEQNLIWAGMAKETAHQIGTPLSSLMAWVQLIRQNGRNDEMADEIEKDLTRLETITARFSKIGSKPELKIEVLSEIIGESIIYMQKRFSKNIIFQNNIQSMSIEIMINKVLFIWVIENICKNAADAMKGKGTISVNYKESDKEIYIYITDTGKGIERSLVRSIFLPGITSKERGWGLGLSLAKRIIEDYHKGKIFVENSVKNKGTTFCIILPK